MRMRMRMQTESEKGAEGSDAFDRLQVGGETKQQDTWRDEGPHGKGNEQ